MEPLRLYLLAGLVFHKLVWELLKRRQPAQTRAPFPPVKAVKIAALAALLAQALLPPVLPLSPHPGFTPILGALLFTASLAVAVTARLQLGRNWSDVESAAVLPGQRLVAQGVYSRLRHPIYTADVLLVAGYQLALNSWLVLLAVPLAAWVWRKAAAEERLLAAQLKGYAAYLKTSARFVPRHAAVGLAALALAFSAQLYLVSTQYNGNWTGLFYNSARAGLPPALANEPLYRPPNRLGYDGQFYHYIAHDPFLLRGFQQFIDAPRLRYPRILLPALAWLLALGQDPLIHPALLAAALIPFFFGPLWLAALAERFHRGRWWGLAFLLIPAALISIERLTVDAWLLALAAGIVFYSLNDRPWPRFALLALAPLARETGVLFIAACGLWLLLERRWRTAFLTAAAALPALAWTLYVRAHTPTFFSHLAPPASGSALLDRLRIFFPYPHLPRWIETIAISLDYVSLAAVLLALALAFWSLRRKPADTAHLTAAAFAALPLILGGVIGWYEPFGHTRTLSPLYLMLLISALRSGSRLYLAPLALLLPRIALEMAPLLPGVRGLMR